MLLATSATLVLTASGLVLTAGTAAAGTSYFPTTRVSTGSASGVDLKIGVFVSSGGGATFTNTWARSYGSPNHRVDIAVVDGDGWTPVEIYHPDVGTGWWEDCLHGTNTNCPGFPALLPAEHVRVFVHNLSSRVCRVVELLPRPTPHWESPRAC
jgi:hypothetical protein